MKQITIDDILSALKHTDLDRMNPAISKETLDDDTGCGNLPGCEYTAGKVADDEVTPSCLVGTILGLVDHDLLKYVAPANLSWIVQPAIVKRNFTDDADSFLDRAQRHADGRTGTWRQSLAAAGVYSHTVVTNHFA